MMHTALPFLGHLLAGLAMIALIVPCAVGLFPHKQHFYEMGCINCGVSYAAHEPCMAGQDFRMMCLVCGRKR